MLLTSFSAAFCFLSLTHLSAQSMPWNLLPSAVLEQALGQAVLSRSNLLYSLLRVTVNMGENHSSAMPVCSFILWRPFPAPWSTAKLFSGSHHPSSCKIHLLKNVLSNSVPAFSKAVWCIYSCSFVALTRCHTPCSAFNLTLINVQQPYEVVAVIIPISWMRKSSLREGSGLDKDISSVLTQVSLISESMLSSTAPVFLRVGASGSCGVPV